MKIVEKLFNRLPLGQNDQIMARGTSVAFIGEAIQKLTIFAIFTFKARVLAPDELGDLITAMSVAITTFFLTSGFSITVLRYGAMFRGKDSMARVKSSAITVYRIALPILVGLLILLNLLARFVAVTIYDNERLATLIMMLSVWAFFQSLTIINIGLLKSKYLVKYEYILLVMQQVLVVIIVIIFISSENLLMVFAFAYPIAAFLVTLYSFWLIRREFAFLFDGTVQTEPHNEKIVRFALYSSLTSSLNKFRDEINTFLIAFFLVPAAVALYGTAFRAAFVPLLLSTAVIAIFTPVVGNLYGKGDIEGIKRIHIKVSMLLIAFSTLIFLVYLFGGKYLLLVFGSFYQEAHTALLIMALANVIYGVAGPLGFINSMFGRPHFNTINSAVLLVIMIGLCYYLIPLENGYGGINGAAIAYAVSNITISLLCLVQVLYLYRVESPKTRKVE